MFWSRSCSFGEWRLLKNVSYFHLSLCHFLFISLSFYLFSPLSLSLFPTNHVPTIFSWKRFYWVISHQLKIPGSSSPNSYLTSKAFMSLICRYIPTSCFFTLYLIHTLQIYSLTNFSLTEFFPCRFLSLSCRHFLISLKFPLLSIKWDYQSSQSEDETLIKTSGKYFCFREYQFSRKSSHAAFKTYVLTFMPANIYF